MRLSGIGFSALEGISWPIFSGIMLAASSLVSRQLGAKDTEGLDRTLQLGFPAATVLGLGVSALFYWGGEAFADSLPKTQLFLNKPFSTPIFLPFHKYLWRGKPCLKEYWKGAGDTKSVLWFGLPFNLLRIPLSYYLAIYMGGMPLGSGGPSTLQPTSKPC